VPIWQPAVKTEAVEGATELAEVPGEKTKQLKEKPAVNLRRKSSNLRGDHDLIGEHDPAGIPNSKLEQVPMLYTFFSFVADNLAKESCNVYLQSEYSFLPEVVVVKPGNPYIRGKDQYGRPPCTN
jgi:hypothetical protein